MNNTNPVNMYILLVEDDPDDQFIFSLAVKKINLSIDCEVVSNGRQALELLRTSQDLPSTIFMDINMPIMNGKECLIELRNDQRLKNIPVTIVSTTSDTNEIDFIKTLNADFINKPNTLTAFQEAISKQLHLNNVN